MNLSIRNYTAIFLIGLSISATAQEVSETSVSSTETTTATSTETSTATTVKTTPPIPHCYFIGKRELKLEQNNDHGFWAYEDFSRELGCDWVAELHIEQRWGSNYTLFWYQEYDLVFLYNLTEKIQLALGLCPEGGPFEEFLMGGGCAQIGNIQVNTRGRYRWVWITRPAVEMQLSLSWNDWTLSQRLRGEFDAYNSPHFRNYGECRWLFTLEAPWEWTCLKISPFISNEFFLSASAFSYTDLSRPVHGLVENRLKIGLASTLIDDSFEFEAWWQWRPIKQPRPIRPHWFNTYQYGVTLALEF